MRLHRGSDLEGNEDLQAWEEARSPEEVKQGLYSWARPLPAPRPRVGSAPETSILFQQHLPNGASFYLARGSYPLQEPVAPF